MVSGERRLHRGLTVLLHHIDPQAHLEEMAAPAVVPELVPLLLHREKVASRTRLDHLDDRPGEGRPEIAQEGGSARADELQDETR